MTNPTRVFTLQRDHDITGISGTGTVAHGVQWPDGTVTLRWTGPRPSTVHWNSIDDVIAINGHGGATRIIWAVEPIMTVPDGLDTNPNATSGYTDGCPRCPDGHRPSASGTWGAHVLQPRPDAAPGSYPMTIVVQRPAGEHVSDADAAWVRARLNQF
ncbi:hypothetical protein [Kitasatospora sp. NPDC004272]